MPQALYFPFASGLYDTRPGLKTLDTDFGNGSQDKALFQLDEHWPKYISNKQDCQLEDKSKYFIRLEPEHPGEALLNTQIINSLSTVYPHIFQSRGTLLYCTHTKEYLPVRAEDFPLQTSGYSCLFEALSNQVQEDIALFSITKSDERLILLHLCAPNHWAPGEKAGKNFLEVHQGIPGMEQFLMYYKPTLHKIVADSRAFVRFAWGLSTDRQLNKHPEAPPGHEPEVWRGRRFDPARPELFVRTERQVLQGFAEASCFAFFIRTYFYPVVSLEKPLLERLYAAFLSMSDAALSYKGLYEDREALKGYLESLRRL